MKKIFKALFFRSLNTIVPLWKTYNRGKLLIIYYHRIVSREQIKTLVNKNMCTEIASFKSQMEFLTEYYIPVSETEILNALDGGKPLPAYSVWVTFDDGYKDNFINAVPVLKNLKISATFFITTGFINKFVCPKEETQLDYRKLFMSWDDIKNLSNDGFGIGCHTVNHNILSSLSKNGMAAEIKGSQKEIEEKIGKPVYSFAYPHGDFRDCPFKLAIPILKECGIRLAVTTVGGSNRLRISNDGIFKLRRFGISYDDSLSIFRAKVGTGSVWQR
jgi:peptidoglycan/xylan/chitin deacetylase (PgdA/CDA1 family)